MRRLILKVVAAAWSAAPLFAQLVSPHPGYVRYPGLPVQEIFGVPGSYVVSPAKFGPAVAASFGNSAALIALNGAIHWIDSKGTQLAECQYGEVTPLLAPVDQPDRALAWLPRQHALVVFRDHAVSITKVDLSALTGVVTSLAFESATTARLLVLHPDQAVSSVTVSLQDGRTISSELLPGVRGAAYLFGPYVIWSQSEGIALLDSAGRLCTLTAPAGMFTAEQMSAGWVHLLFSTDGSHWALYLNSKAPTLTRLPEPGGSVSR